MMTMDDKLIGFLYALVGAAIALLGKWAIDAITRRSEKSSHAAYLCVRVVCELDRFATGCAAVAQDFGPEPDDATSAIATASVPSFAPHDLPVDWRSIDIRLVYDVLNLPGKQALADKPHHRALERCMVRRRKHLGNATGAVSRARPQGGQAVQVPAPDWQTAARRRFF